MALLEVAATSAVRWLMRKAVRRGSPSSSGNRNGLMPARWGGRGQTDARWRFDEGRQVTKARRRTNLGEVTTFDRL